MRQTRDQTRLKVAEVMRSTSEALTATEIAVRCGMSRSLALQGMSDLREAGHQIRKKRERRRWIYHDEDRYLLAASPAVEAETPKSSSPVYWTPEMTAVLRAHAWGRSKPAAIAAMLSVSERAVITKAAKIGVRFNSSIERPVRERIADLASQGWRPSRIARQVGLDPDLVAMHLPPAVSPGTAASPS